MLQLKFPANVARGVKIKTKPISVSQEKLKTELTIGFKDSLDEIKIQEL